MNRALSLDIMLPNATPIQMLNKYGVIDSIMLSFHVAPKSVYMTNSFFLDEYQLIKQPDNVPIISIAETDSIIRLERISLLYSSL